MKNLKISQKLLIGYGTVLVLMIVIISLAISVLSSIGGNVDILYSHAVQRLYYAGDINAKTQEMAKNILHAIGKADDADYVATYFSTAEKLYDEINTQIEKLSENYGDDQVGQGYIAEMRTYSTNIWNEYQKFKTLVGNGNVAESVEGYDNNMMTNVTGLYSVAQAAEEKAMTNAQNQFKSTNNYINIGTAVVIGVAVAAVIAALILAFVITKIITSAVTEVRDAALQMAEGNFDINIKYVSKDEVGELADDMRSLSTRTKAVIADIDYILEELKNGNLRVKSTDVTLYVGMFESIIASLRKFRTDLNDTLTSVTVSSDQVASGSEQVALGAQSLSQGATEQASSIEELAAEINIVSDIVKSNADKSSDASDKMNEAVTKLSMAKNEMDDLANAIKEISASSEDTKKTIKTIEDIAFQTNILALNAAVEAARAGAAGKGFAVVADEVRNLAGKSAEAAKNTTVLIEGTVSAIERGRVLSDQVVDEMNLTESAAQVVLDINNDIAKNASSAAESITQISTSVEQISGVVQNNSATAEESAAASEELSGQSQILKELTARFQLYSED